MDSRKTCSARCASARGFRSRCWRRSSRRRAPLPALSGFGGGLGDIAASARFDAINAGTRGVWPGLAILAGALGPDRARPLTRRTIRWRRRAQEPDRTRAASGVAVEEIIGQGFVSLSGFVSKRTARAADGVEQTFAPRLSAVLTGGYTFGHDTTVGAFASALRQGDARDANGAIANSSVALVTAGAALALPFWDAWRLQTTLFTDVPIPGWGRNQTVGFGGTLAVIRFWI